MTLIWIAGGIAIALLLINGSFLSLFAGEQTTLAVLVGLLAGLLGASWTSLGRRIADLERQSATSLTPAHPVDESGDVRRAAGRERQSTRQAFEQSIPATSEPPSRGRDKARPEADIATERKKRQTAFGHPPPPPVSPEWSRQLRNRLAKWLNQDNLPVIVGVLASLIGVAALLRYASDQGWLTLPIELRLAAVALAAVGSLVFGWRQRDQRRLFSLSIQGGAIGVLVMTVFAALQLYGLIAAMAAFALLTLLVAATIFLALAQHSLALAVLALVAGFAAPILVGSGDGNHVALFSWYLLLNLAVFTIARVRDWTLLYRLGFVFTFIIATLWGVLDYSPEKYAGAQGFLIAFFLLYAAIPLVQAVSGRDHHKLDVMLVFGLPLIAFPLQMVLVDFAPLPVAFSALSVAAVYLLTALGAGSRILDHPLRPSLLALAVGFATLAVPFAFSGPVIPLVWAAEGAALVWLGIRQQRRLHRLAGLLLQLLAGLSWWLWFVDVTPSPGTPVFNGVVVGALALVLAAFFSLHRFRIAGAGKLLLNLLAAWALGWWLLAGALEIIEHLTLRHIPDAWLAFTGLSVLLLAWLVRATGLVLPAIAVLALVLSAPLMIPLQIVGHDLVYAGWGLPGWLVMLAGAIAAERVQAAATSAPIRGMISLALHLTVACMAAAMLWQLTTDTLDLAEGWGWTGAVVAPLAIAVMALALGRSPLTPAQLPAAQRIWVLRSMQLLLLIWLLHSLTRAGGSAPLPYLPLLNPMDLVSIAVLLALAGAVREHADASAARVFGGAIGALAVVTASVIWLRSAHHLMAVDWRFAAMASSNEVQAGLSILWTMIGTLLWVRGSRRGQRTVWMAGALLLGLVLGKLLLIDRGFLSTLAGIASFLAFGGLLMLVGYLAPAPPKDPDNRTHATEAV